MKGKELTDELIDELISCAKDVADCFEQGCGTALAEKYLSNAKKSIQKEISSLRADLARVRKERDKLRECIGWINTWVLNDGRGYKDPETLLERILVYTNKVLESEE